RNPKPATRNPKPESRNKPETQNPKPETRNPQPGTLNPKPETRGVVWLRDLLGHRDGKAASLPSRPNRISLHVVFFRRRTLRDCRLRQDPSPHGNQRGHLCVLRVGRGIWRAASQDPALATIHRQRQVFSHRLHDRDGRQRGGGQHLGSRIWNAPAHPRQTPGRGRPSMD
ncbi:hypothetical protein T484DRAFT_1618124, partial [Baffinella frigidus]